MTETFYDLLDVTTDAERPEIERAYRQRIKETHPDLNDAPDASEQTARLVEARDVLTEPAERARYDRLGHDAYVGSEFSPETDPDSSGTTDPGADGGAQTAAEAARGDSDDGPTNARAGAEERRRRERRARRDVNFGDANSSTTASGTATEQQSEAETGAGAPNGEATATTDGWTATAGPRGTNGRAATAGSTVGTGGSNRRTTAHPEPPSWSDTSQGWAARTPASPEPGLFALVRSAVREVPGTAIITFVLYPLLVLGAFFPPFPLLVNLIVVLCLLAMIGAVQSVPGLGVAIYGGWTIIATLGLLLVGANPLAPLGIVVLGTTWLPLGLSILTSRVLDS